MKKSTLILSSLMILTLVACNSGGKKQDDDKEYHLEFASSELALNTGVEQYLQFKNEELVDMGALTFTTSDPNVVDVDSLGRLYAGYEGTATITASDDKDTTSCTVTVTLGEYVPIITFTDVAEDNIDICIGDVYNLSAVVRCNNKDFEFESTYESVNNNGVLKVEGQNITALKTGSDTIKLSGTFGDYVLDPITLDVNVRNSVQIILKDGNSETEFVNLYTTGSFAGQTYETEFTPTFTVVENGQSQSNFTVSVVNNESGLVNFDTTTYKITALKGGTCAYKVSFTSSDGTLCEKSFPISINRPVTYFGNKVFELDQSTGELPVSEIFASQDDKTLVSATLGDGTKDFAISGGKITNLDYNNNDAYQIIVYNKQVGYIINAKVYSKIIRTASDLAFLHCGDYETSSTPEARAVHFDGTYILANDIDATSYTHAAHCRFSGWGMGQYDGVGLRGVFDGRGHTIKGITLGSGGLFGMIYGGTVRNLGIADVTCDNPLHGGEDEYVLATYLSGATIENVYISVKQYTRQGYCAAPIGHDMSTTSTFNHCLVEVCNFPKEQIKTGSLFSTLTYGIRNNIIDNFGKHVYVVSNFMLCHGQNPQGGGDFYVDAANRYSSSLDCVISEIKRYDTRADMISANNDYSSFDANYWELVDGMLTFKTAK